jgi:rhodanese-related sulfurtransferase
MIRAMDQRSRSSDPTALEVPAEELLGVSSEVHVIDVREPSEFATGSVPGARSIPAREVRSRLYEIPRRSTVYLLCANGARSLELVPFMRAAGYDAWSVRGGLWALQQHTIARGDHSPERTA